MSEKLKNSLQESYNRLKNAVKKVLAPKRNSIPQLTLQPCRNKSRLENYIPRQLIRLRL
ncbi:MAG: hypothetical protein ACSLE0_17485 [Chitinophagaceae bacterium]